MVHAFNIQLPELHQFLRYSDFFINEISVIFLQFSSCLYQWHSFVIIKSLSVTILTILNLAISKLGHIKAIHTRVNTNFYGSKVKGGISLTHKWYEPSRKNREIKLLFSRIIIHCFLNKSCICSWFEPAYSYKIFTIPTFRTLFYVASSGELTRSRISACKPQRLRPFSNRGGTVKAGYFNLWTWSGYSSWCKVLKIESPIFSIKHAIKAKRYIRDDSEESIKKHFEQDHTT